MKTLKMWFLMRLIKLCIRFKTWTWLETLVDRWHELNDSARLYEEELSSEGQRIPIELVNKSLGLKANDKRLLGPKCTCDSSDFASCPIENHFL